MRGMKSAPMISSHKPCSCQKSKKINQIYDLNYKKYNGRNPLHDRDRAFKDEPIKGQLISECLLGVTDFPNKQRKI